MALRKRESKLFSRLRKYIKKLHFTRIESSTVQGIPDVHGCGDGKSFWIELKSTSDSFPKLSKFQQAWCYEYARHSGAVFILYQDLLQRRLKLYRVVGGVDSSFSFSRFLVLKYTTPDPPSSAAWSRLRELLVQT